MERPQHYLVGPRTILDGLPPDIPTIVAWDFNHRVPRKFSPTRVYEALLQTFEGWEIVTGGTVPGLAKQAFGHVAVRPPLACETIQGVPRETDAGARMSDHDGGVVDLRQSRAAPE